MIQAERFCLNIHALLADRVSDSDIDEARLKLSQSRAMLNDLQNFYNDGKLTLKEPAVRSEFRFLIINLMWVAFRARTVIDFKIFRMLVLIESAFTMALSDSSRREQ